MKAKMKDNLIMLYQICPEFKYNYSNELIEVKKERGMLEYFETKEFLKSIEGKTVELVFTGSDAFEKKDNNFWLPNSLWETV